MAYAACFRFKAADGLRALCAKRITRICRRTLGRAPLPRNNTISGKLIAAFSTVTKALTRTSPIRLQDRSPTADKTIQSPVKPEAVAYPELAPHILQMLDTSENKYVIGQRERIKLSISYAMRHDVVKGNVIDVGGHSGGEVYDAWRMAFPSASITPTKSDLHDPLPFASGSFDGCIAGEIFEHIGDRDFRTSIKNFTGVINLLSEILRVLKPGGRCLLTTPNVCSFKNIALAMCNTHPFMYTLHYREYAKKEIEKMLAFLKANVVTFETNDVFRQADELVEAIRKFCEEHKLPMNDRGNDFFLVFEKPLDWQMPELPHNTAHIVYPNDRRGKFTKPWMPGREKRYDGEV